MQVLPFTVVELFARYVFVIGVACHVPLVTVPTLVSDDPVTFEASVVPVIEAAGAVTVALEADVTSPLPFTVNIGIAVALP